MPLYIAIEPARNRNYNNETGKWEEQMKQKYSGNRISRNKIVCIYVSTWIPTQKTDRIGTKN